MSHQKFESDENYKFFICGIILLKDNWKQMKFLYWFR